MIQTIFDRLAPYINNIVDITVMFVGIFMVAWFLNGYCGFHFELSALQSFYLCIAGVRTANYGINSAFNSGKGEPPVSK